MFPVMVSQPMLARSLYVPDSVSSEGNRMVENIRQVVTEYKQHLQLMSFMLVLIEGCSEKIGGPNKTVEIDNSKFGRRKFHRRHR
jgi:hypothetical protein